MAGLAIAGVPRSIAPETKTAPRPGRLSTDFAEYCQLIFRAADGRVRHSATVHRDVVFGFADAFRDHGGLAGCAVVTNNLIDCVPRAFGAIVHHGYPGVSALRARVGFRGGGLEVNRSG